MPRHLAKPALPKAPARRASPAPQAGTARLPEPLKAGIEALSGFSLDAIKVHYNSPEPQRIGALAFARGHDIHLGPGHARHLPHEAWHVVQQARRQVAPTLRIGQSMAINDHPALEREADVMGARALSAATPGAVADAPMPLRAPVHAAAPVAQAFLGDLLWWGTKRAARAVADEVVDGTTHLARGAADYAADTVGDARDAVNRALRPARPPRTEPVLRSQGGQDVLEARREGITVAELHQRRAEHQRQTEAAEKQARLASFRSSLTGATPADLRATQIDPHDRDHADKHRVLGEEHEIAAAASAPDFAEYTQGLSQSYLHHLGETYKLKTGGWFESGSAKAVRLANHDSHAQLAASYKARIDILAANTTRLTHSRALHHLSDPVRAGQLSDANLEATSTWLDQQQLLPGEDDRLVRRSRDRITQEALARGAHNRILRGGDAQLHAEHQANVDAMESHRRDLADSANSGPNFIERWWNPASVTEHNDLMALGHRELAQHQTRVTNSARRIELANDPAYADRMNKARRLHRFVSN